MALRQLELARDQPARNIRYEDDSSATFPRDSAHLAQDRLEPSVHVSRDLVLVPERQVGHARAHAAITQRQAPRVANLNVRAPGIASGHIDGFGVDIDAPRRPPLRSGLSQDRSRPATRIKQRLARSPGETDHRDSHRGTQGARPLGQAAIVLAHARVRHAQPGDEASWPVLDDPDLKLPWIGDPPQRLVMLDHRRQAPPHVRTQERTLLQHPGDHPEARSPAERMNLALPERQCFPDTLRPP